MSEGVAMQLGPSAILAAIPHRPPLLLLDHVRSLEPPTRIVAVKNLHADDPWFAGHFPGHPVFPCVLIVEALAQAGAVLAAYSGEADMSRQLPYLTNIDQARVRKPVYPGQQLELIVTRQRTWGAFWQLQGEARVDGEVVASARLTAALVSRPAPPASGEAAASNITMDTAHAEA
jgi:3-hydroxyacyl-[acyl-carrier-protein] dehydratase